MNTWVRAAFELTALRLPQREPGIEIVTESNPLQVRYLERSREGIVLDRSQEQGVGRISKTGTVPTRGLAGDCARPTRQNVQGYIQA
jgi:hypothetical protein